MYRIKFSKDFIKSLKKIKRSGKFNRKIEDKFELAVDMLLGGEMLPDTYKDHELKGKDSDKRECHIKGDLLLVYKQDEDVLVLLMIDIGTHAQIFG